MWYYKMKSVNSPLASTEIVRGRSENPLLVFAEAPKFPRGWLLELDPEAQNMTQCKERMLSTFALVLRL
ncbi:hypothetical protein PWEIH_13869 [Listeria weihenstephanensis FSL R9-0317]|uniref:Uncharacterized protein n=1 Tax=Listeria weihenstephanensis TaxID=1006155 RepID=A0A1S7FTF5_9LIST|nr:hypothetical protein UE46_06615 [Listeria weihenstephanensis]EUJ36167.1 hypothetical protein PWEIH_13869 [Listeria weihenstephanensis FSL R9-0317]